MVKHFKLRYPEDNHEDAWIKFITATFPALFRKLYAFQIKFKSGQYDLWSNIINLRDLEKVFDIKDIEVDKKYRAFMENFKTVLSSF